MRLPLTMRAEADVRDILECTRRLVGERESAKLRCAHRVGIDQGIAGGINAVYLAFPTSFEFVGGRRSKERFGWELAAKAEPASRC